MNADGSGAVRLTTGRVDIRPACSPDGKWVYYFSGASGNLKIERVPLDGSGKSEPVAAATAFNGFISGYRMSISPNSKTLAYSVQLINAETQESTPKIALLDLESLSSPQLIDAHPLISGGVQYTPDGKALAYPIREGGFENVWAQPLDRSAGHRLTNFSSDQIEVFFWSPDGKTLGVLRRHSESDVVVLQESKP